MTTEADKVDVVEVAKIELAAAAAPAEPAQVEKATPAEPTKVEEVAIPVKTETAEETVKADASPEEAEKVADSDAKERNGPLKVLATIKRNLASPRKGDKKEEGDAEKEEQPTSPNSKEKVLEKLKGRIFPKHECHCKHTATEETEAKKDGEAAAAEVVTEEPVPVADEAVKLTEEKKEDKSKGNQLYGQIVKALTPRKASGKLSKASNASSIEKAAEIPKPEAVKTETAAEETAVVAEVSDKENKGADSETSSPGMLTAIKRKATGLVHSLEEKVEKVYKDKDAKDEAKAKTKEEQVKTEQPVAEAAAAPVASLVEEQAVPETPVEQEQSKMETKKETEKDVVGHFIDGVKAKIQEVLNKDHDHKEATKATEEPAAAEKSGEAGKVIELPQVNGDQKKEVFPVNELKYEDEEKKKDTEKAAAVETSTTEQTSQKWKNRMSGLFKPKKAASEEVVAETPAVTPAPATAAAAVEPTETTETPAPTTAATTEGEESPAKDCAIRLAQLYMQTPAAEEAATVVVEDKKAEAIATVESAAVEATTA